MIEEEGAGGFVGVTMRRVEVAVGKGVSVGEGVGADVEVGEVRVGTGVDPDLIQQTLPEPHSARL